jgi:hypothetical protein
MRRRRNADEDIDSVVVITEDGTRLRCTISAIGRAAEPRWVVLDSDAKQYVGPIVESDRSPDAVERLISAWWKSRSKSERARAEEATASGSSSDKASKKSSSG